MQSVQPTSLFRLVFNEEVEGMTGEKRVVRVGVPGLHVLLQAKPERGLPSPGMLARLARVRCQVMARWPLGAMLVRPLRSPRQPTPPPRSWPPHREPIRRLTQ
jgi:hypothetical protein